MDWFPLLIGLPAILTCVFFGHRIHTMARRHDQSLNPWVLGHQSLCVQGALAIAAGFAGYFIYSVQHPGDDWAGIAGGGTCVFAIMLAPFVSVGIGLAAQFAKRRRVRS